MSRNTPSPVDDETQHIILVGDYKILYDPDDTRVYVTRRPFPGEQEHLDAHLPDLLTRLVALSKDEFGGRLIHFSWQNRCVIQVRGTDDPNLLAQLYIN